MVLRFFAQLVSIIFHPLIMLTYMLILLLLVNPYLFGVAKIGDASKLIIGVFVSTFFLPAFAILLMRGLGFIKSFEMRDKQERIGPFIATAIFYLWIFQNVVKSSSFPTAFSVCVLGATIALFVDFLINLFYKVSLHATGVGGLVGMVIVTMWMFSYGTFNWTTPSGDIFQISMNLLLATALFIAGLVGTCRLILAAHEPKELLIGYLVGFFCQVIALKILL